MEELILLYYSKVFSLVVIFLTICNFLYIFTILNKKIILPKSSILIERGEKIESIINKNIIDVSKLDIFILKKYYQINNYYFKKFIHFGDFEVNKNISFINFLNIISKPSNVKNKITIIEGWSKKQLREEISKYFKDYHDISYEDIIADTYYFEKNLKFSTFLSNLKEIKNNYFVNSLNNKKSQLYSNKEIMVISSLVEKEGLDKEDKAKIASVIFNRLKNKMKLQIDATVIFSITNGNYNLDRKLLIKDLKFNHPFNTYVIDGLPPKPISYVGKNTLEAVFSNHETDFLFYFFNKSLKRHIFSKDFEQHKIKLNEYRKN